MNYATAVQGPVTRATKLRSIQESAETELKRQLSDEEVSKLTSEYSLDGLYSRIVKVN